MSRTGRLGAPAQSETREIDTRRPFRSRAAEFTSLATDLIKVKARVSQ
jgi:hypothetical protein